jgi:hypothetical protein
VTAVECNSIEIATFVILPQSGGILTVIAAERVQHGLGPIRQQFEHHAAAIRRIAIQIAALSGYSVEIALGVSKQINRPVAVGAPLEAVEYPGLCRLWRSGQGESHSGRKTKQEINTLRWNSIASLRLGIKQKRGSGEP